MEGEPEFTTSQRLPELDYAGYAELLGFRGLRMASPDDVERVWDAALAADRPVVIQAIVNADVPTFPPTLRPEQQEKLAQALSEGDPDAEGVREQLVEQEVGVE